MSHRLSLAKSAVKEGLSVHIASNMANSNTLLSSYGFTLHHIPFSRSGQNPFVELGTLYSLYKLLKELKPSLVHAITVKPVIYGGIANRLSKDVPFVAAISGLGTVFTAKSIYERLRRSIVSNLYKAAFNCKSLKVIFQNPDDRDVMLSGGAIKAQDSCLIRGSGVDLDEYIASPEPNGGQVKIVMASRLLIEKGVYEFYKAAEELESRGLSVEMRLIGTPDSGNPKSLPEYEFDLWRRKSFIKVLGFRSDIAAQYANSNIVCLPSYYGEGLPKSLIEAAACGRAIITTDSPGCNYAIENGVTGLLVPPKDHVALADAIEELVVNEGKRKQMGEAGRAFAEKHFDINVVVKQHLAIYEELLSYE